MSRYLNVVFAGKNPYGELDVLGAMPQSQLGEWESMMNVSGYHGMPSFKVQLLAHRRSCLLAIGASASIAAA